VAAKQDVTEEAAAKNASTPVTEEYY